LFSSRKRGAYSDDVERKDSVWSVRDKVTYIATLRQEKGLHWASVEGRRLSGPPRSVGGSRNDREASAMLAGSSKTLRERALT